MKRKILSALMTVCMVLVLIPMTTKAGTSLPQAGGGVITLTENVVLTSTVEITQNTTIDLAGFSITTADGANLGTNIHVTSGTLTVKDSSADSTGAILVDGEAFRVGIKGATGDPADSVGLTIEAGVDVTSSNDSCVVIYAGTLTTYGNLTSSGNYATITGSGADNCDGTVININGGSVTNINNTAVYHPQVGTMTVKDGVITGTTGIEMRAGGLTVEGGTITATGAFSKASNDSGSTVDGVAVAVSQHTTNNAVDVTIKGGTLGCTEEALANGAKALYEADLVGDNQTDVTLSVTGGTFNAAVASENVTGFITGGIFSAKVSDEFCADTYGAQYSEGKYVVGVLPVVAKIGDVGYTSLADAVKAVPTNGTTTTIELVTSTADSFDVKANQNVVINLNGYTLTLDPAVGSAGTETSGSRVLFGGALAINNGTLACGTTVNSAGKVVKVGIANYGTLTLTDVVFNANENVIYTINNRGNLTLAGATTVATGSGKDSNGNSWAITNDPYNVAGAGNAVLNIASADVEVGNVQVELYGNNANPGAQVELNISAGNIEKIVSDGSSAITVKGNITGGVFGNAVPSGYCAEGYIPNANADGTYGVHVHSLKAVSAKEATCAAEGNVAYWYCEGCDKYYSDENGSVEITKEATVINKAACDTAEAVKVDGLAATCTESGVETYWHCETCQKYYSDAELKEEISEPKIIQPLGHKLTAYAEKPATCIESGNIAYWYCETCQKYYSDADAKNEISAADTQTAVTACDETKAILVKGYAPTCTESGLSDGTKCATCDQWIGAPDAIAPLGHSGVKHDHVPATCTESGWEGEIRCERCDVLLEANEENQPFGHAYVDGVCVVCGEVAATSMDTPAPVTGDTSNTGLWVFIAVLACAGLAGIVILAKKTGYHK